MHSFCVLALFFIGVVAKDLHVKELNPVATTEYIRTEVDVNHFEDLYGYDEVVYNEKERYARHVEMVTESVLEHLLMEIKKKYPASKNESSGLPKMMKRLQMQLKKMNKKKKKKKNKKNKKKRTKTLHRKKKVSHKTEEHESTMSQQ